MGKSTKQKKKAGVLELLVRMMTKLKNINLQRLIEINQMNRCFQLQLCLLANLNLMLMHKHSIFRISQLTDKQVLSNFNVIKITQTQKQSNSSKISLQTSYWTLVKKRSNLFHMKTKTLRSKSAIKKSRKVKINLKRKINNFRLLIMQTMMVR